jgi:plastocyanin
MAQAVSMTASVDVLDNSYSPATVTILAGGTVTWTWKGGNPHSVTSGTGTDDNKFPSSAIQTTGTFMQTFATKGNFPYFCKQHGASMSGTVVVQ